MKKSSFFLMPTALVAMVLAHAVPPSAVYILMPSNPALTAMSSALDTLGYTHASPVSGLERAGTYTVLEPGTIYKNISRDNPEARFILPWGSSADDEQRAETLRGQQFDAHDADSIRAFFSEIGEDSSSRLLELDVFAAASNDQAQTWVALCDFLGLGYSVVERLKLWHFPK